MIENNNIDQLCAHHHSGLMQEHKPQQQSGCDLAASLNCWDDTSCAWLPNDTPVHPIEIDLDKTSSNNNLFRKANITEET